jgi:hypothetical protein
MPQTARTTSTSFAALARRVRWLRASRRALTSLQETFFS